MKPLFTNRIEAGRQLAHLLQAYKNQPNTLLLATGLGGLEVGLVLARLLDLPLDVFLIHRLRHPQHPHTTLGALATGGHQLLNQHEIRQLGIAEEEMTQLIQQGRTTLQRLEAKLRGHQVDYTVKDHTVILVDDGVRSATTMALALQLLKQQQTYALLVASPVAVDTALERLKAADRSFILETVSRLGHVDEAYAATRPMDLNDATAWLAKARELKFHDFDLPQY